MILRMEKEHTDVRKLEPAAREQLRRVAIRLFKRGYTQTAIARELGLRRPTVTSRLLKERSGQGLQEKKRGRPASNGRKLTPEQDRAIRQAITDKTPDQMKLRFALWDAQAVRALIKSQWPVDLPVRTVRLYLKRWGFTPQRPLKRALEQNAEAVQAWLKDQYPAIALRAKAEGAEIHWADETALSSIEHYPRGYVPKGRTPVLAQSRRERVNLISSVTNQGKVRFMLYRDTLGADVLIRFLERLIQESGRKVFLVLDDLRVHHSGKVRAWLDGKAGKIELFFLPSYSPELNPDEYLNADLKARMNAAEPVRQRGQMQAKVLSHLRSIQKQPARVRAYFAAKHIRYAA
jgi:transposase